MCPESGVTAEAQSFSDGYLAQGEQVASTHPNIRGAMRLPADGLYEVRIPVCLRHSIDSQIAANEPIPAAPACSAAAQMDG